MIILSGATGTIGSALMRALPLEKVPARAVAHSVAGRMTIESHGVEAVVGDFDQLETLVSAFAGGDRLFLLSPLTQIR